ncbi:BrnT family toxin [Candidatus Saccharibacteria bacterium]|nr:BrnT family toxin [Candidatus Saccharibacteria bacterium]
MKFEYDTNKGRANFAKHGISFEDARSAFADENRKIYPDKLHSNAEQREICLGKVNGNILTVVFTKRKGVIRIISAGYYRKGKKLYEQS